MDKLAQFLSAALGSASGGFSQTLLAIGAAYLGGVLTSLTPCVYPMIPITVSVVGGLGTGKKAWHEVWMRGLFYVLGMAVTYSFLGVLAGITGKVFGTFTNTAGWYLSLGIILALSALVMMEVLPFDPAVWWETLKRKFGNKHITRQQDQRLHQEMTWAGAFGLGASSGFIAAPCTTPVLTSILAFIAETQSVGMGLALMVSFSLGLGTLLLVVAAFAGSLRVLPKSGAWMSRAKTGSGLLLLTFSGYLIYRAGALGGSPLGFFSK